MRLNTLFPLRQIACAAILALPLYGLAEPIAPFEIVSADLGPYAVENHPQMPGALVELTEAMSQKLGQPTKVKFYPWARAMAIALTKPRAAIIPLTRTPERDPSYQWLAKLYSVRFVFISRTDKQKPITSIDDARNMGVAVLRGSPNLQQLLNRKFDQAKIMQESNIDNMLKALDHGMVDAFYGPEVVAIDTIRATNRDPKNYQFGLMLEKGDVWLGGAKDFTEADSIAMTQALDALKKDGTYSRILKKYHMPE